MVTPGDWPVISEADALLLDVARRIQLSRTKHEAATTNFEALCKYVDRRGSPLHGKVEECYPSGSFAIGTAIASRVATSQHDVDVVIELSVSPQESPRFVLETLFEAINGESGTRYFGKVEQNSRCVTVHYDDGTTVDLMPVARLEGHPDRAGHLFHYNSETSEQYHKAVNPWGFARHFNEQSKEDRSFYDSFQGRRLLVEGHLITADTQPMPTHAPLEQKSARVVALQLLKRARDISYRKAARKGMRSPPSIIHAAISLDAGPVASSLTDEVINVATAFLARLRLKSTETLSVFNPTYQADEFTDRWPENFDAQKLYEADLQYFISKMTDLKRGNMSIAEKATLLRDVFGESVASTVMENYMDARRHEMEAGRLYLGERGKVLGSAAATATVGAPVVASTRAAARPATREGGDHLPE